MSSYSKTELLGDKCPQLHVSRQAQQLYQKACGNDSECKQTDRQTDRQAGIQTSRQADIRRTGRHTNKLANNYMHGATTQSPPVKVMRPSGQLMFPARSLPTMHDQVHVGACASTSHVTGLHSKLVLYACWALAPVDIPADGPAQHSPGIVTSTMSATSLWSDECQACGRKGMHRLDAHHSKSVKQADAPRGFCCAEHHMCAFLCMNTHQEQLIHEALNACITGVSLLRDFDGSHKWHVCCHAGSVRWVLYPSSSLLASQRPQ